MSNRIVHKVRANQKNVRNRFYKIYSEKGSDYSGILDSFSQISENYKKFLIADNTSQKEYAALMKLLEKFGTNYKIANSNNIYDILSSHIEGLVKNITGELLPAPDNSKKYCPWHGGYYSCFISPPGFGKTQAIKAALKTLQDEGRIKSFLHTRHDGA